MTAQNDLGIYLHWPYCAAICPYCDFNVYRARNQDPAILVASLVTDLHFYRERLGPRPLSSLFLGGGTPSLMPPADVARLIEACDKLFGFVPGFEITLEANPTDAEAARFTGFASAGVNRLSLGVQAFDDDALKLLGRNHSAASAQKALAMGQKLFPRVSLDLIYARPGQALATWEQELTHALATGVEHISPYQLTIEHGTAFDRAVKRGRLAIPDPDSAADFYDLTQHVLTGAGFDAYEVSNHARGAKARSVHNQLYWRSQDWIGLGPGAHGRIMLDGQRTATTAWRRPEAYCAQVAQHGHGIETSEPLSTSERRDEFWLMGLRLSEGVARADAAIRNATIDDSRLAPLVADGLVQETASHIALTPRGRLLFDSVTRALLA